MALAILFHVLCAQHVSDINISIIRSLRLFCWITTLVVLFLVRCVLEFLCGWVGVEASVCNTDTTPTKPHRNSSTHRTKNNTTNVVIQQNSRKLLMMDILMSETCWAHKKWNKIVSAIKLVFYASTNKMCIVSCSTTAFNTLRYYMTFKIWDIRSSGMLRRYDSQLPTFRDLLSVSPSKDQAVQEESFSYFFTLEEVTNRLSWTPVTEYQSTLR